MPRPPGRVLLSSGAGRASGEACRFSPGTNMTENLWLYFSIGLGSALGGIGRFYVSGLVAQQRAGETFPYGTLVVNVIGSLVIGFLAALTSPEGRLTPRFSHLVVHLLMIGFCGGFTTFSSFSLQTLNLVREGQWLAAGANAFLSLLLCLVAVWLGYFLGQIFNR